MASRRPEASRELVWPVTVWSTLLSGIVSGAASTLAVIIARWKIEALQRAELVQALDERRQRVQEIEERNAQLLGSMEKLEAAAVATAARVEAIEKQLDDQRQQVVILTAERLRRDRYIRALTAELKLHGIAVPPFAE